MSMANLFYRFPKIYLINKVGRKAMNSHGLTEATALGKSPKLALSALLLALLTGCANTYRTLDISEVNAIPDDCRNQTLITDYLTTQLNNTKPATQKGIEYDAQVSAIKSKIWRVRYMCHRT
jgi:hypothetical protein